MNAVQNPSVVPVPAREPEVQLALQYLSNQLAELEAVSAALEKRVEIVLLREDENEGAKAPNEPRRTSLGQDLYVFGDRVSHVFVRLSRIIDRCEL